MCPASPENLRPVSEGSVVMHMADDGEQWIEGLGPPIAVISKVGAQARPTAWARACAPAALCLTASTLGWRFARTTRAGRSRRGGPGGGAAGARAAGASTA